jgi:serine/threonine protein kinase
MLQTSDILRKIIKDVVTGLFDLHHSNLVHCDLKPSNIIQSTDGTFKIIDFGSMRTANQKGVDVMCTYQFCAPEALEDGALPTKACDAYSLGATIYYCIFQGYLFDKTYTRRQDVSKLHTTGRIKLPTERPAWVDKDIFGIMLGLLNPDSRARTRIIDLYFNFIHGNQQVEILDSTFPIRQETTVPEVWPQRGEMIESIYDMCTTFGRMDAFALAVDIMDRFVRCYRRSSSTPPPILFHDKAAFIIATTVLIPNDFPVYNDQVRVAIADIITKLSFELYNETCDMILQRQHLIKSINYEQLKEAIKSGRGNHVTAARLYSKKRVAC